jgi:hypothetical protein
MAEDSQKFIGGKIVRSESPLNIEMPFEKLEGFIKPTELFYVPTHFPIPRIDRDEAWLHALTSQIVKPGSRAGCHRAAKGLPGCLLASFAGL